MSRRLLVLPALFLASALAWTALGSFSSVAEGQEDVSTLARAHEGAHAPSYDEPIFVLVLGGDARVKEGNPERTRADSIHIVSIVPPPADDPSVGARATIVGIPRDSYVPIRGHGNNKINAALFFGGPKLMVETVEALSGCRFDYSMLTSFKGFINAVDRIGGITFTVPKGGFRDDAASADFKGGKQLFSGKDALAWSRSRKARPLGDISRSEAQGELLIAALREARADFKARPTSALRYIAALRSNLHLDIPLRETLRLGLWASQVKPADVTNFVVDGAIGSAGAASVVRVTDKGRSQLTDVCADGLLN